MKVRKLSALGEEELPNVPIYIMTSDLNHGVIVNFFANNYYFGYPAKDIVFFEQGLEPCFFNDGRIIIETPTKIAMAPDGNGGIYNALQRSGCIGDMQKRGVVRYYYFH
jgi:UDP-N-acetylglucosamine/UDP-N-acetylgalactosamine diphosphorylase